MVSSVEILKSVYGGDGLGRLGDGRVIFVPGAFAGERVKAEIISEHRNFVKGKLIEVCEANPERISDTVETVPGMVFANLSPRGEAQAKEEQLREFFSRARFATDVFAKNSELPAKTLNYRNKVVYHFAKQKNEWVIGYREEPSHTLVNVFSDPLARAEINEKLPEIRLHILALLTQGAASVRRATEQKEKVTIRWSALSGVQWWLGNDAPDGLVIKEKTCGRIFEVPADGFYQVNPEVGEALVKAVMTEFAKDPTDDVLDLYCGVGVFGLCLAPTELTGIESGRRAIEFAKKNASANNQPNARFFAAEVERNLKRLKISDRTIIIDPPRDGLAPNVPKWLVRSGAKRIFYVSCDPATLMRDLKQITSAYDIECVRWLNMFPRTARFETLVVLRRKK